VGRVTCDPAYRDRGVGDHVDQKAGGEPAGVRRAVEVVAVGVGRPAAVVGVPLAKGLTRRWVRGRASALLDLNVRVGVEPGAGEGEDVTVVEVRARSVDAVDLRHLRRRSAGSRARARRGRPRWPGERDQRGRRNEHQDAHEAQPHRAARRFKSHYEASWASRMVGGRTSEPARTSTRLYGAAAAYPPDLSGFQVIVTTWSASRYLRSQSVMSQTSLTVAGPPRRCAGAPLRHPSRRPPLPPPHPGRAAGQHSTKCLHAWPREGPPPERPTACRPRRSRS